MDTFKNKNSEPILRWLLRTVDELDQIVFVFISKLNAQNARNFQLFEASNNVRVVYMKGFRYKYTDRVAIRLLSLIIKSSKKKIRNYRVFHFFSIPNFSFRQKQVLHLDDPIYSKFELEKLKKWETAQKRVHGESILICTNEYTKNWFSAALKYTEVLIIEQGFQETSTRESYCTTKFSCVYSSPYIHLIGDKHGEHSTWGSELLIRQIIPKLHKLDPEIELHLVGEVGANASNELSKLHNVFSHGRVSFNENMEILSKCSVGLYPRIHDHKRSILKIFSYIGAGLPVVTFNLEDTRVVKDHNLGISVDTTSEFIDAVLLLKNNPNLLEMYRKNIINFRAPYNWKNLAKKMRMMLRN